MSPVIMFHPKNVFGPKRAISPAVVLHPAACKFALFELEVGY